MVGTLQKSPFCKGGFRGISEELAVSPCRWALLTGHSCSRRPLYVLFFDITDWGLWNLVIPEIKLFSYQLHRICSIMAQFPNPPIPQFLNPVCGSLLWTSK